MAPPTTWKLRDGLVRLDHPVVVGILNVTPDSFSDGGRFLDPATAVERGVRMVAEGAELLDVGGESTRPGAAPVSAAEERARLLPVLRELRRELPGVPLSVDTVKADVAQAALDEGAQVVNDVSAFRLDPRMAEVCAAAGCGVVLMHSRGGVSEMASFARADYGADPVAEMMDELRERMEMAERAGVHRSSVVLDPGVGFSKRGEHSLAVLGGLPRLVEWGYPVLVGVSRKRFIGEITGVARADERVDGTTGANVAALMLGARLFRVHDVGAARRSLDVAWAVLRAGNAA